MKIENFDEFKVTVNQLIDSWCEKRKLCALRFILQSWPFCTGLTDEWGELLTSLKSIRAMCIEDITEEELQKIDLLVIHIERALFDN